MCGKYVVLVFLCIVSVYSYENVKANFKNGIHEYAKAGKKSSSFDEFMRTINLKHAFRHDVPTTLDNDLLCAACDAVIEAAIEERRNGLSTEDLVTMIIDVCVSLNIEPRAVCEGAVRLNADSVLYIVDNKPDINSKRMCATVMQNQGCDGPIDYWQVNIAEGKTIEKEKGLISESQPFKILQLTDIHYDPLYLPGGYANCDEPLCCQSDIGLADDPADAAGYWGDYRDCDSPRHSILNAFEHISKEHPDIDYIYYTGDTVSHRIWGTSRENNTRDQRLLLQDLSEALPNIPIIPIFGNHETHPVNVYAPLSITDESVSINWLFDEMAEVWGQWLPSETKETIRKGGYYTFLLRQGLRIVALNSNVGYTGNWWLLYEDVDPYGQLQWLADTLYEAEQNNELVHIISHVPSGDSTCYLPWSREFRRIIERFSNTITAIFYGHSHNDEWLLYHSRDNPNKPINVAWHGGSLATCSNLNFNYKLYEVDNDNYEVLDFQSWTFNLTEANLTPMLPPVWFKLYSFKEAFGLKTLAPSDVRNLLVRMTEDHSLMQLYYKHRYREADTREPCDDTCMKNLLCRLVTMEYGDNTCDDFLSIWE